MSVLKQCTRIYQVLHITALNNLLHVQMNILLHLHLIFSDMRIPSKICGLILWTNISLQNSQYNDSITISANKDRNYELISTLIQLYVNIWAL